MFFTSCIGIETTKPDKAYSYWAGEKPPPTIKVLNGDYWESAHWTHEYIVFLKMKVSDDWWDTCMHERFLILDTAQWVKPVDAPDWFIPNRNSLRYIRGKEFFDQGTRYFFEPETNVCFIYEIQL